MCFALLTLLCRVFSFCCSSEAFECAFLKKLSSHRCRLAEILGTRQAGERVHDLEAGGVSVREGPQDPAVPADGAGVHRRR